MRKKVKLEVYNSNYAIKLFDDDYMITKLILEIIRLFFSKIKIKFQKTCAEIVNKSYPIERLILDAERCNYIV